MDIRDEKQQLFKFLLTNAVPEAKFEEAVKEIRVGVEEKYLKRWKKQFYSKEKDFEFPVSARLINRFMLGADPEFLICTNNRMDNRTTYMFAEDLGYTTLGCFGCDMSGRQAEIRAYPSRFALDVVASILETLRWMAFTNGTARKYNWQSVAFIGAGGREDGFGGHVHFGRKRGDLKEVVASLDRATAALEKAGILDFEGCSLRTKRTHYGKSSDYREQVHGFEYRTMPTWLHSPQAAHLVLTISKMCVLDKDLGARILHHSGSSQREVILNAMRASRFMDDDVRIAMRAIELHGWPFFKIHYDFKDAWGISSELGHDDARELFFPTMIEADQATKEQLFDYLVRGQRIPTVPPKLTWTLSTLPKDHYLVQVQAHVMGVPEIAQNLISRGYTVMFVGNHAAGLKFTIAADYLFPSKAILGEAYKKYPLLSTFPIQLEVRSDTEKTIQIEAPNGVWLGDEGCNKDLAQEIKLFLSESGLFPIAHYKQIDKLKSFELKGQRYEQKKVGRLIQTYKGVA